MNILAQSTFLTTTFAFPRATCPRRIFGQALLHKNLSTKSRSISTSSKNHASVITSTISHANTRHLFSPYDNNKTKSFSAPLCASITTSSTNEEVQQSFSSSTPTSDSIKGIDWVRSIIVTVLNESFDPAEVARAAALASLDKSS